MKSGDVHGHFSLKITAVTSYVKSLAFVVASWTLLAAVQVFIPQ